MSKNRNQHYIPRLLLKRFLTDTPRGRHLFQFVRGEGVYETPLSHAGAERDYYRDEMDADHPNALDDFLRSVESRVDPIIESIVSDFRFPVRTSEEFDTLMKFVRHLSLRTPSARALLESASAEIANDVYEPLVTSLGRDELEVRLNILEHGDSEARMLAEVYWHSKGKSEGLSEQSKRILHRHAALGSSPAVLLHLKRRYWRILVASGDPPFVIGDDPVVIHDNRNAIRTGLKHRTSRVSLALSPKIVIQGCSSDIKNRIVHLDSFSIRKLNGAFVRAAYREVFADQSDFEWQHVAGRRFNSLDWINGGPRTWWPSTPK